MQRRPRFKGGDQGFSAIAQSPEHAAALGTLAAAFAELEHSLVMAFQFLTGTPYYKAEIVMFALSNHRARYDIIKSLGETIALDDVKQDFLALIKDMPSLATKRNKYFHSTWIRDDTSAEIFVLNHKVPSQHQDRTKPVSSDDLFKVAMDCTLKARAISTFFAELHASGRSQSAFA
jgi:hypothetical protein